MPGREPDFSTPPPGWLDAHAAWWCCPVDARRIAAIGTYASGRSPRH